jgi:hypothetical protein
MNDCTRRGVHGRLLALRTHAKTLEAAICEDCGADVQSQIGLSVADMLQMQGVADVSDWRAELLAGVFSGAPASGAP